MSETKPDKRQKIMDAVEQLFTNRRFHELTLDQVARKAGVGKGTIYLYFKDKDNLFFQTVISGFDELCELLKRKVSDNAPFHDQMLDACAQIVSFFTRRKQLLCMIQNNENRMYWERKDIRERWMEKRKSLIDAAAQIIAKGVAEGCIRKDIPPDVLAKFLLGMLRTRVRDLESASKDMQQFDVVLNLFIHGASSNICRNEVIKKEKNLT